MSKTSEPLIKTTRALRFELLLRYQHFALIHHAYKTTLQRGQTCISSPPHSLS
ncbi:hypothetical protein NEOLEDRAFT_1141799 [Neolentinus lepideus HHB14362 ss-1]|uniref:Uncharacterized protein n=1 Tax=Neolentinus lepideus HHB14362 ss-1 TaxID=1314782 RepID=A0A165NHT6_9AGAM|nr:hypothetical protein NEOLEDRAFT_1141799 [Neolentinus lepideus HHB14362 ss-1]